MAIQTDDRSKKAVLKVFIISITSWFRAVELILFYPDLYLVVVFVLSYTVL